MPTDPQRPASSRDGTSQSARVLRQLDPDYAPVDERTTRDLLAFARAYSRELKYFDSSDPAAPHGDWSGFIGPDIDLDAAAAYAEDPGTPPLERSALYARPHFALFLASLQLLALARAQLNTLTRRHLEFAYRDVLRMVRKRAVADSVHILIDLDARTHVLQVPAGTPLRAGKDSLGRDLIYRTNRELIANRSRIADIRSLRAEIRVTDIKGASRPYLVGGLRKEAVIAMLRIALGQPAPGDRLPVPVYPGVPPEQPDAEVTYDVMLQVQRLVGVVESQLGMPLFDDFRALMRLKPLRQAEDAADWMRINAYLEKAGRTRDPNFTFAPQDATDFQTNLRTVLNKTATEFARLYDGLPEVKSIEDVYATYLKRPDVADFVRTRLYLSLDDFKAMMQTKVLMDNQWSEINRLLEDAGRRKRSDPTFRLPEQVRTSRDFDQKLQAALNEPDYTVSGGLDAYYQAFLAVERYFFMPAEHVKFMMFVVTREGQATADEWDWDKVYEMLATAHREKVYARRRDALQDLAQDAINDNDRVHALAAMLVKVLDIKTPEGEPQRFVEESLQRIDEYGVNAKDLAYLADIAAFRESAQRNRENVPEPIAEKAEWRNLYPADDARAVLASSAAPEADGRPRWKTFGRGEQPRPREPAPPPIIGWALGSPLLSLAEGERTIVLTLGFSSSPGHFDADALRRLLSPPIGAGSTATVNPFQVEVSTTKGWVQPATVKLTWDNPEMTGYPAPPNVDGSMLRALAFTIELGESEPALAAATRDMHGIDAPWPVLRLMLKPIWSENKDDAAYVTHYASLRLLVLMRAHLVVHVVGLTDLSIRNDQSVLDAKKPFEPFGSSPSVGSRFYFGHPELAAKRLDSIVFKITWIDVPVAFASHYTNYTSPPGNASFTARVALSDGRVLRNFSGALALFDIADATKPVARALTAPAYQGDPETATTGAADVTEWKRHFLWELNAPDFQHTAYPSVALQKSLDMAAAIVNKNPTPLVAGAYHVRPPVTPKIKSLTIDYIAAEERAFDGTVPEGMPGNAFHIHPFGSAVFAPEGAQPGSVLLPRYDFAGELYMGLSGVTPPQNVALLFEMVEGSGNPDLTPAPVEWSVLSGNRWVTLHDGSVLSDGTRGLINSGIVELALKRPAPNTLLPGGLYWIRAAMARAADSVPDVIDVHTNAVLATFDDHDNAPDHLRAPLPPGSSSAPATPLPGVAAIRQPYPSFGGKMAELDTNFYVRVSERLRHKQRALTPWDYERLVLEKFPQIYKAKCLRADPVAHPRDPGRIELIVIPDVRNRMAFDPFEPKASADLIRSITEFLQDKTNACAHVIVKNPHYVPVKVRCGVRFMPGQDESFCRKRLNDELNRFLSPWAYEEAADLVIGGNVYANSIIDFIERRDYVDYIAQLKLFTSEDDGRTFTFVPQTDDYHATAKRNDGVLVAARQHQFDVIGHADYRAEVFSGINYMQIELDFVVG
jgi:hypothetical protein